MFTTVGAMALPGTAPAAASDGCSTLQLGVIATGTIQVAGQVDCYEVAAASGDQLRIRTVTTSGLIFVEKRVVRPSGTDVCGWTGARETTCAVDATGVHQIRMQDRYGSAPGTYRVTVQRLNDPVGCSALPYGQAIPVEITSAAHVSCWAFSGAKGKVVNIKTLGTYGALNPETEVIRPGGTVECERATIFERTCALDATGTHFLLGKDNPGKSPGVFNLTLGCATSQCHAGQRMDFDGDGRSEIAVFRPSTGQFFVREGASVQWGTSTDLPVPADYDGDGDADVAVFRPSTQQWFVRDGLTVQFGAADDVPVPGDYDGDGRDDVAVFRPSTQQWFVRDGVAVQFGSPGDVPIPGDYDGDGVTDIAVFRPQTAQFFVRNGLAAQWGTAADVAVPADYDGDGKADVGVYRPSTGQWFLNRTSRGMSVIPWGMPGDVPVAADYDGDGSVDVAVYRPSTGQWFVHHGPAAPTVVSWGASGDRPLLTYMG